MISGERRQDIGVTVVPLASNRVPRNPSLSVIIPAYRAQATLPRVLQALLAQLTPDVEVIVVDSSGVEQASQLQASHDWVTVIGLAQRTLPGCARNLGADRANGSQLVFLDADAVPTADWLARLRSAAVDGAVAVAGAVTNGTPGNAVGTASYLLEFSEFMPHRQGVPVHGASCNLLVQRSAFVQSGGFCEDLWPGEDTVLTVPWAQRGHLAFSAGAGVRHLNRTRLLELIRHQFRLGRSFAVVCDQVEFPYRRFSHWPLLLFAPILRAGALAGRLRGRGGRPRNAVRVAALVTLGLVAWTIGVAHERSLGKLTATRRSGSRSALS